MANVVYLLGAGASAEAIPVVNQLNARLQIFYNLLEASRKHGGGGSFNSGLYNSFILDLKDVISKESKHFSIDTYARKLWFQKRINKERELEYRKLKAILSCFFLYEQRVKSKGIKDYFIDHVPAQFQAYKDSLDTQTDKRYDAFFATLLEEEKLKIKLPPNINIITWNYDNQVELSLNEFQEESPSNGYPIDFMSEPKHDEPEADQSCVVRLNGEAFYQKAFKEKFSEYASFTSPLSPQNILNIYHLYHEMLNNPQIPLLQFAWETNEKNDKRVIYSKKLLSQAYILVVIGYSFPSYNARIDKEILSEFAGDTVYIQAPKDNMDSIISRYEFFKTGINANPVYHTDLFFIPPELLLVNKSGVQF